MKVKIVTNSQEVHVPGLGVMKPGWNTITKEDVAKFERVNGKTLQEAGFEVKTESKKGKSN